jgi:cysteine desulfurase/selenocysteine lyase
MELTVDRKKYFPIFKAHPELVYLDSAATTMRHQSVIQRLTSFYSEENANIHRGVYDLSNKATSNFEQVRSAAADFLGKSNPDSIAFTTGTTEAANIIASSFLQPRIQPGDNIVTTIMEHHANFIPWQRTAKETGAEFRVAPVTPSGELDLKALSEMLDKQTRMLAVTHISNTLGTINPIDEIIDIAHQKQIPVFIDAAQSAAYYELKDLDYDFLAFSGHKIFGPFGTGILYADEKWHDQIKPFEVGGGIIESVSVEETTYQSYPRNLDAGTPNVSGIVALGTALTYLNEMDRPAARTHVESLASYTKELLKGIPEVDILGTPEACSGIVSFTIKDIHPHDIASFLNQENIAVRAGMHCTQPLLQHFGIHATVRASFATYNEMYEAEKLAEGVKEIINFWS